MTDRFNYNQEKYPGLQTKKIDVNVITHPFQRFAVWFGGSMLASQPEFLGYFHTRAQYAEQGPRIARHNQVTHTKQHTKVRKCEQSGTLRARKTQTLTLLRLFLCVSVQAFNALT